MDATPLHARDQALHLLCDVLNSARALDEAFESRVADLEPRDRGFVRLLVATTLRRLGQIDEALTHCLSNPLPDKAILTNNILRLGVCQLLFLGTPAHAAVSTSVSLARERGQDAYKNLVNAVLRRMARDGEGWINRQRAGRLNTPDWLWKSWVSAYGEATAQAIAEAHLSEAPIDITVTGDKAWWADKLEAEVLPTGSLRRAAGGRIEELPGFSEGAWWVQDAAAALPARLLGDVTGQSIADLCAAPGGKTAQLAAAGAQVTAVDRSESRLRRLRENMERLALTVEVVAADAIAWTPSELFDSVLLDAPCSATGTLRRHPDAARLKTSTDTAKLARVQAGLFKAAVKMLKPGGTLVYCVCSLQPEEGPGLIGAALAGGAPLSRLPVQAEEIGGLAEAITPEGDVRTLPCHWFDRGGMDGFFIARLRKTL